MFFMKHIFVDILASYVLCRIYMYDFFIIYVHMFYKHVHFIFSFMCSRYKNTATFKKKNASLKYIMYDIKNKIYSGRFKQRD